MNFEDPGSIHGRVLPFQLAPLPKFTEKFRAKRAERDRAGKAWSKDPMETSGLDGRVGSTPSLGGSRTLPQTAQEGCGLSCWLVGSIEEVACAHEAVSGSSRFEKGSF